MVKRMFFKVDLPKRSSRCCGEGEELVAGSDCISLLVDNPQEAEEPYGRQDFCLECWTRKQIDLESVVTHWRGRVPDKVDEEPEVKGPEKALALLKALASSESEAEQQQAFVLALFLARQRVIAARRELLQDDGAEVQLYEVLESEELYCVKKQKIAGLDVAAVQKALADKLR